MALALAPTKTYFGFGSKDDYVVLDGGRCVGRIVLSPQSPPDRNWMCTITAVDFKPSIDNRVYAATRAGDDGFQGSVAELDVVFPKYSPHQMEPASSAGG